MRRTWRHGALSMLAVTALAGSGLAVPVIAAASASAATGPTPVLHYSFDQTGGTTIADDSGNHYDGTLAGTGASFANGELNLPGGAAGSSAAYVSIPNTPFVGQKDLTVSVWLQNTTG